MVIDEEGKDGVEVSRGNYRLKIMKIMKKKRKKNIVNWKNAHVIILSLSIYFKFSI